MRLTQAEVSLGWWCPYTWEVVKPHGARMVWEGRMIRGLAEEVGILFWKLGCPDEEDPRDLTNGYRDLWFGDSLQNRDD